MDPRVYRKAFPPTKIINVGTDAEPHYFAIDSMSTFNLMNRVYKLAQEEAGKGKVVQGNAIGRIISTRGDEIFEAWAPDAIVDPKVFSSLTSAKDAGHDIEVDPAERDFFLTEEIRPTHVFKLLNGLLDDGGGSQAAGSFPEVGRSDRVGTDVEGIRQTPE